MPGHKDYHYDANQSAQHPDLTVPTLIDATITADFRLLAAPIVSQLLDAEFCAPCFSASMAACRIANQIWQNGGRLYRSTDPNDTPKPISDPHTGIHLLSKALEKLYREQERYLLRQQHEAPASHSKGKNESMQASTDDHQRMPVWTYNGASSQDISANHEKFNQGRSDTAYKASDAPSRVSSALPSTSGWYPPMITSATLHPAPANSQTILPHQCGYPANSRAHESKSNGHSFTGSTAKEQSLPAQKAHLKAASKPSPSQDLDTSSASKLAAEAPSVENGNKTDDVAAILRVAPTTPQVKAQKFQTSNEQIERKPKASDGAQLQPQKNAQREESAKDACKTGVSQPSKQPLFIKAQSGPQLQYEKTQTSPLKVDRATGATFSSSESTKTKPTEEETMRAGMVNKTDSNTLREATVDVLAPKQTAAVADASANEGMSASANERQAGKENKVEGLASQQTTAQDVDSLKPTAGKDKAGDQKKPPPPPATAQGNSAPAIQPVSASKQTTPVALSTNRPLTAPPKKKSPNSPTSAAVDAVHNDNKRTPYHTPNTLAMAPSWLPEGFKVATAPQYAWPTSQGTKSKLKGPVAGSLQSSLVTSGVAEGPQMTARSVQHAGAGDFILPMPSMPAPRSAPPLMGPQKLTLAQLEEAMGEHTSSVIWLHERRVDLDQFDLTASNYSLLRAWVQDDPERKQDTMVDSLNLIPPPCQNWEPDRNPSGTMTSAGASITKKVDMRSELFERQDRNGDINFSVTSLRAELHSRTTASRKRKVLAMQASHRKTAQGLRDRGIILPNKYS